MTRVPKQIRDAVWTSAFAAAFVESFRRTKMNVGFDRAADLDHAEEAIEVADLAVKQLVDWRRTEG